MADIRSIFQKGGDNKEALLVLRREITRRTDPYLETAFPKYTSQKEAIAVVLKQLLEGSRLEAALFPKKPVKVEDADALGGQIKSAQLSKKDLRNMGVVNAYGLVKPADDDRGGDDPYDDFLYASLYLLPTASVDFARWATYFPEDYKDTRPYMEASGSCTLPNRNPGYYFISGAFGVNIQAVIGSKDEGEKSRFWLADSCKDSRGEEWVSKSVASFDGMKIYLNVKVEEEGRVEEKILVLSASIAVMNGKAGFLKDHFTRESSNLRLYAHGPAREILDVVLKNADSSSASLQMLIE